MIRLGVGRLGGDGSGRAVGPTEGGDVVGNNSGGSATEHSPPSLVTAPDLRLRVNQRRMPLELLKNGINLVLATLATCGVWSYLERNMIA
jgi:hypothetical protein